MPCHHLHPVCSATTLSHQQLQCIQPAHLEGAVHVVLGDAQRDHGGVAVHIQQRLQRVAVLQGADPVKQLRGPAKGTGGEARQGEQPGQVGMGGGGQGGRAVVDASSAPKPHPPTWTFGR